MKKILLLFITNSLVYSQTGVIEGLHSGYMLEDLPAGSYIKDIDGELDKFNGIWRWTNGNQILTFVLQKKEHQLNTQYNSYRDYIIGDYSYTVNNGISYIVNTIISNAGEETPNTPMYAGSPQMDNTDIIDFYFKDALYTTKKGCSAIFQFISGSPNQLVLTLKNPEMIGRMHGEPAFIYEFSIPNNVTLTKVN